MIKIENVVTPSSEQWKSIIIGMRHPLLSYDRIDSKLCEGASELCDICPISPEDDHGPFYCASTNKGKRLVIGTNDLDLMMRLRNAGPEHRKFMRMITVYMDITAPLYWWKEFDTYKVGTVANSCSTMHKIHAKKFTLEDFSCEHLMDFEEKGILKFSPLGTLQNTINELNDCRKVFLETKDKEYWWQMIQLLPSSYNQKRKIMLNYEVLATMYHQRKNHKLDEWREFCSWIEALPYSELITGDSKED